MSTLVYCTWCNLLALFKIAMDSADSADHVHVVCKQSSINTVSDVCESLIFCLECASIHHDSAAYNVDTFYEKLEKSALYRAYLNLDNLNLLEQILYTQQKFSEYNDT